MDAYNYRGYRIVELPEEVRVYDPIFRRSGRVLYRNGSGAAVMGWIDAYIAGHQWAVDAAMRAAPEGEAILLAEQEESRK